MSDGVIAATDRPGDRVPPVLAETLLGAVLGAIVAVTLMAVWTGGVNTLEGWR